MTTYTDGEMRKMGWVCDSGGTDFEHPKIDCDWMSRADAESIERYADAAVEDFRERAIKMTCSRCRVGAPLAGTTHAKWTLNGETMSEAGPCSAVTLRTLPLRSER